MILMITAVLLISLDHSNPVGNIKGIKILTKLDITLLQSPRSDKSIDLVTFNLVKFLHCCLDLTLVCLNVNNEDKGIAILNKLH